MASPAPVFGPVPLEQSLVRPRFGVEQPVEETKEVKMERAKNALAEGKRETAKQALSQSFGDLVFNNLPLASGYLKKTAEATEKYYQMRKSVPPELQAQMDGDGVLRSALKQLGKNTLETGLDTIELINTAIPVNNYTDVKNLMNATRMHYGLVTPEELKSEEATTSRVNEIENATDSAVMMAKEFVNGFKNAGSGVVKLLKEKNPAKRKEIADELSFGFFSGLSNFPVAGPVLKKNFGVNVSGDTISVKGKPVRKLGQEEAANIGGAQAIGSLANSMASWGKISPWVGNEVLKTVPLLKSVAVNHPILFQGVIASANEEMFQAVASNIAGVPYNFGDTMFGMAMQLGFTLKSAAGAKLKGIEYDPLGLRADPNLQKIDFEGAKDQLEQQYKSFLKKNGRLPSDNEMQTIMLDKPVPGTDNTWSDVHQYLAQKASPAFGENRMAFLKQEGRPGIEIPDAPKSPNANYAPLIVSRAKDFGTSPEDLVKTIEKAGSNIDAIESSLQQKYGDVYGDMLKKAEKAVDDGAPIGELDIADPLRKAVFGEKSTIMPKVLTDALSSEKITPEGAKITQTLAEKLGGEVVDINEAGHPTIEMPNGAKIRTGFMDYGEGKEPMSLIDIEAETKGGGLGTKTMEALKEISDETGKQLHIGYVNNPEFFEKFSWLKRSLGGRAFDYVPKKDLGEGTPVRSEFSEARLAGKKGPKKPDNTGRPEPEDGRTWAEKLADEGGDPNVKKPIDSPESAKDALDEIPELQRIRSRLGTTAKEMAEDIPVLGKRVEQTFRTDKFDLDEAGQNKLKQVQQSLGLMDRDVRTWPEVEEMAKELGANPFDLLRRVQGNRLLSDAEVEALRQTTQSSSDYLSKKYDMLEDANKAGDMEKVAEINSKANAYEKILDASVRKLIGGGTELGRGVAIYRKIAAQKFDDPTFWYKEAAKLVGDQKNIRIFKDGGSTKVATEGKALPEALRVAIDDLMANKDQIGMSYLMSHLRETGNVEKAVTLWKAGLLSSPTTDLANTLGNTTMRALEDAKDIPATIIDTLISPITGKRTKTIFSGKASAEAKGFIEGGKKAWEYLKTGVDLEDNIEKWDMPKEVHFDNALLETYTQAIFRKMGAEDMPFRYAALRRSIAEQAAVAVKNMDEAELNKAYEGLPSEMPKAKESLIKVMMAKPSDEIAKIAMQDSEYATFRRKTLLSEMAKGARSLGKRYAGEAGALPVELTVPFVRTPSAVGMTMVDYTPAGFLGSVFKELNNARKGTGFDQKAFVESAGRSSIGSAIIALGVELARNGLMTGNPPENAAERKLWTDARKQPNSLFLGGKWRKLDRVSPIGNLLTLGAEWSEIGKDKTKAEQIAGTAAAGVKSLTQQSFLMGLSQAVETLSQPERNLENYVENAVRGLVPNIIGRIAQGADPLQRESDPWNIAHYLANRIPILHETTPAKQTAFGIPMRNQRNILQQLFDPFSSEKPSTDPVIQEMIRLNQPVSMPAKGLYSPQEYRRVLELRGKTLYPLLRSAVDNAGWKNIPDDAKRNLIQSFAENTTRQVNQQLKLELAERWRKDVDAMSPNDRRITLERLRGRDNDLYWLIQAANTAHSQDGGK